MAKELDERAESGSNFDAALRQRAASVQDSVIRRAIKILTEQDKAAGRRLPRDVLTYIRYVNERFLAAFAKEAKGNRYALKGGNAIVALRANKARFPASFDSPRETRDLDMRIDAEMSEDDLRKLFSRVVGSPDFRLATGLSFGEPKVIVEEARDGFLPGARIECNVFLGPPLVARNKGIPFKLEISFGALGDGSWTVSRFPAIADLVPDRPATAGIGGFDVAHVVPEMMFADKLHAVVRYRLENTRLKDIFDLHCLATQYDLDVGLIKDCLLHVFKEFQEEHLLVGKATDIPGLDPARFATDAKRAAWVSDWPNWTGVLFGAEREGQMASIDLDEALRSVASAVDRMGLFDARTAAIAEEARLRQAPIVQVLAFMRAAAAAAKPGDVEALRRAVSGVDPEGIPDALRALAFGGSNEAPGAVRLAKAFIAGRSVEERSSGLVERFGPLLTDPNEVGRVDAVAAAARSITAAVAKAALLPERPERATSRLSEAAASIPTGIGSAFPLRALISGRVTLHLQHLATVADELSATTARLTAAPRGADFEAEAAKERKALRLAERRAAIEETRSHIGAAEGFCDEDDRRRLNEARAVLALTAKALGTVDRSLARATAISDDLANGSLGKGMTPEKAADAVIARLGNDVKRLKAEIRKAEVALQPFKVTGLELGDAPSADGGPAPGR